MKIIDSHCHYNLEPLYSGRKEDEENQQASETTWSSHWQRAQEMGVCGSLVVGTNLHTSQLALEIAATEPQLLAAVGIHPSEAVSLLDQWGEADAGGQLNQQLETLSKMSEQASAIGEMGLDYYWLTDSEAKAQAIELQKQLFIGQIRVAAAKSLPVSIHVRDREVPEIPTPNNAYWDALAIIKSELTADLPVIFHCISGPLNYIKEINTLGGYIGVAANVTYPNAETIRTAVAAASPEHILLETDAPYLPPQGYRGKTCEPWMVAETAKYLKQEMRLKPEQLLENTIRLFPQFNSGASLL